MRSSGQGYLVEKEPREGGLDLASQTPESEVEWNHDSAPGFFVLTAGDSG